MINSNASNENHRLENGSIETVNPADCYTPLDEAEVMLEKARFWLEGVFLFVVGTIGLVGNILAILILSNSPENTAFNMLLI